MLIIVRGTAPNSLSDWPKQSRDQRAAVGVIGFPRCTLYTVAAYSLSRRCHAHAHYSTYARTPANFILSYKRASLDKLELNVHLRIRYCRRACSSTDTSSRKLRDDATASVRVYNHLRRSNFVKLLLGFSGSNRGQERVSNWIDGNFKDASCFAFAARSQNPNGDFCFSNGRVVPRGGSPMFAVSEARREVSRKQYLQRIR